MLRAATTTRTRVIARKTVGLTPWRNSTVPFSDSTRHVCNIALGEVPEPQAASASPKLLGINGALGGLDSTSSTPTRAAPTAAAAAAPSKRKREDINPCMPDTVRMALVNYPEYLEFVRSVPDWFADAVAYYRVGYKNRKFFTAVCKPALFRLHLCLDLWNQFEAIFAAGVEGWVRDSDARAGNIKSFECVPVVDAAEIAESVLIVNRYIAYLQHLEQMSSVLERWQ